MSRLAASSIRTAVNEIEHEVGTLEGLTAPPADSMHLARWSAGLSEIREGLAILARLADDLDREATA